MSTHNPDMGSGTGTLPPVLPQPSPRPESADTQTSLGSGLAQATPSVLSLRRLPSALFLGLCFCVPHWKASTRHS